MAALFLSVIVATMVITLGHRGGGVQRDEPTASDRRSADGVRDGGGTLSGVSCPSPVPIQPPAADLATTVAQQPAGTCFLLAAGTYRFHDVEPKDGMAFIGASTESVIVDGDGYENAFHGTADGVTIADMTFQNFNDSAGTSRQEQAPIRGTAALWQSDRGAMATNWLITDIVSHSNYASGIFLGEHWTVRNSVFHSNGVTGIGGDEILGGVIEANIVHSNGGQQAGGALVNGGGLKITQAGTPTHPVVVRNNEFYENENIAIWCDIGCDGLHVFDNYIHDHVSRGVMYELSSNVVVRGNMILRSNTWTNFNGDWNAGAITIGESSGALVENNLIDVAQTGVVVRQTKRPASGESFLYGYTYVNWVSATVTVRNNVITNTGRMGISTGITGTGLITQPQTITFTGNSYDNPSGMDFWWNDGVQQSFAQWQAAGRDASASASFTGSPQTQVRGPQSGNLLSAATPTTTTTAPAPTTTTTVPVTVAPSDVATTVTVPTAPAETSPSFTVAETTTTVLKAAELPVAPAEAVGVPTTAGPQGWTRAGGGALWGGAVDPSAAAGIADGSTPGGADGGVDVAGGQASADGPDRLAFDGPAAGEPAAAAEAAVSMASAGGPTTRGGGALGVDDPTTSGGLLLAVAGLAASLLLARRFPWSGQR
ncbi:MAG: right-handed parallel beta-helix repeat-containing protein [Actinomycetota bacterium]